MRTTRTVMFALALLAAAPLTAQEFVVKPGPEHAFLKEGEGVWDATAKSQGKESKGKLSVKMALNGLWMLEHYESEIGGVAFEGRGATSYDPAKKKYVNLDRLDGHQPDAHRRHLRQGQEGPDAPRHH